MECGIARERLSHHVNPVNLVSQDLQDYQDEHDFYTDVVALRRLLADKAN